MSADYLEIRGRFKDEKSRYKEVQQAMIDGLSQHLEPEDCSEEWEEYFTLKDEYLEFWMDEPYGNWGRAMEFIRKDFVSAYQDIVLEFYCVEYYGLEVSGEKITYNGKKCESVSRYAKLEEDEDGFGPSFEGDEFQMFQKEIGYKLIE